MPAEQPTHHHIDPTVEGSHAPTPEQLLAQPGMEGIDRALYTFVLTDMDINGFVTSGEINDTTPVNELRLGDYIDWFASKYGHDAAVFRQAALQASSEMVREAIPTFEENERTFGMGGWEDTLFQAMNIAEHGLDASIHDHKTVLEQVSFSGLAEGKYSYPGTRRDILLHEL